MDHHHMSPLKLVWYIIWAKPAAMWVTGRISFWKMLRTYLFWLYVIFILPLVIFGIYKMENTPDRVWVRPAPIKLEELRRQQEPSIFDTKK